MCTRLAIGIIKHQISFEVGILSLSSKFQRKSYDMPYVIPVLNIRKIKGTVMLLCYDILFEIMVSIRTFYHQTLVITYSIVIVLDNLQ